MDRTQTTNVAHLGLRLPGVGGGESTRLKG